MRGRAGFRERHLPLCLSQGGIHITPTAVGCEQQDGSRGKKRWGVGDQDRKLKKQLPLWRVGVSEINQVTTAGWCDLWVDEVK